MRQGVGGRVVSGCGGRCRLLNWGGFSSCLPQCSLPVGAAGLLFRNEAALGCHNKKCSGGSMRGAPCLGALRYANNDLLHL